MQLHKVSLRNFRSYRQKELLCTTNTTIILGANAAGKSNLIESIFLLTTGKSFRSEKEGQLVRFGAEVASVKAETEDDGLEVLISHLPGQSLRKKYLVNGIARRRTDFAGKITAVLFTPEDLDLVTGQPGNRRRFLDEVLEQVDPSYRLAHTLYTKALRQRNALLEQVREIGVRDAQLFSYWDSLLIANGTLVTKKREAFITAINKRQKDLFPFVLVYDHSIISPERLLQYKHAEVGAGVTLVGPHRDDILIQAKTSFSKTMVDLRHFASRGQQRLVTLELKLAQLAFLQEQTQTRPLLLLDDIFSELDSNHIAEVLRFVETHQTIITTTHRSFVENVSGNVIELDNNLTSHE